MWVFSTLLPLSNTDIFIGDVNWSQYHGKSSNINAESDTNELSASSKEKEEKKLQEEMDFMKTLDLKFQEKDAIMELSVCDTIRTYMECQKGKNPEVQNESYLLKSHHFSFCPFR